MVSNIVEILESKLKSFNANLCDVGKYSLVKTGPMKQNIKKYELNGIGNISIMEGKAMLGLMKMDTIIFTSLNKDIPLISYDRINAFGNDILIIEMYDVNLKPNDLSSFVEIKNKYASLNDKQIEKRWYDDIRLPSCISKTDKAKKVTKIYDEITLAYLDEIIKMTKNAPSCDTKLKAPKVDNYVQGLLNSGGPSTDVFIKYLGKEETTFLFENILFNSKENS